VRGNPLALSRTSKLWVNLERRTEFLVATQRPLNITEKSKIFFATKVGQFPENDIWIAATAKQHGLTVASRDSHFDYIDGLSIQHW
jgi:predicted nucleic acid-binding protein